VKPLFIGILLILSCSQVYADTSTELDTYYPLEVGSKWIYSYRLLGLQQQSVKSYDETRKGYVLEIKNRANEKHQSIVQKRDNRVEIIGDIRHDGLYKPLIPPHPILVLPLKTGSTWEYADNTSYKQQFKVIGFVKMTVNAGKYLKVLKVEKTTSNLKDSQKDGGKSFLYFAPNVGLIREELSGKDGRISLVMEIVSYYPGNKRKK